MLWLIFVAVTLNFSNVCGQCLCSDWIISEDSNETDAGFGKELYDTIKFDKISDYRLPTWLHPIHYDLQIQPFFEPDNFTFSGHVIAWFSLSKETNLVTLHSSNLRIKQIDFLNENLEPIIQVVNFTFDTLREFLLIETEKTLTINEVHRVKIGFSGELFQDGFKGFTVFHYVINGKTNYGSVTHFEPTQARSAFPCFDEPSLKATFNVSIIRPVNMTSLSNMPLIQSVARFDYFTIVEKELNINDKKEIEDDGWVIDYFDKSVLMSTYLVAFAVSDFDYVQAEAGDTLIRIWARSNAINQTEVALKYTPKMLLFLEEYLGIPYSLPKLDLFAIPNIYFGAMENWGLITFNENVLFVDPQQATADNCYDSLTTVAHELSHQWFGNLVTMKWWNDIWLNEGITSYMTDVVYEETVEEKPDWYVFKYWNNLIGLYEFEADEYTQQLSRDNLYFNEVVEVFSYITYFKGQSVTRMMEKFAGTEVLLKGLKKYLSANMFGNVEQDELWLQISQVLNETEGIDMNIKEIMDTWTKQKGLPIITVNRNYENQTAYVSQKSISYENRNNTFWTIPLIFITQHSNDTEQKPVKWLKKDEEYTMLTVSDGIPEADEWILFNPSFHGYYLVNYDNKNWEMLIEELIKNHTHIPAEVRMSLVSTLHTFQLNNLIPIRISYSILEYLRHEIDSNILRRGLICLFDLIEIFESTPHYHLFKTYLKHVITPIWFHVNSNEENTDITLKNFVFKLACLAGIQDCLDRVKEVLLSLVDDRTSEPLNRFMVNEETMCAVIHSLSNSEWEKWLTMKWKLSFVTSQSHFIVTKSLTCSSNKELLYDMIKKAILQSTGGILDMVQRKFLLQTLGKNYFNRRLAFDIVKKHWDKIAHRSATFRLIDNLASNFVSKQEVDELKQFLSCSSKEISPKMQRSYRQMIGKVVRNIEQKEENINNHLNWLQEILKKYDY